MHAEVALHSTTTDFYEADVNVMSQIRTAQGIYGKKVNADVLKYISSYHWEDKHLYIDFDGINEISYNNVLFLVENIVKKFCVKEKCVFLCNVCNEIKAQIEKAGDNIPVIYNHLSDLDKYDIQISYKNESKFLLDCSGMKNDYNKLFDKRIEDIILDCSETMKKNDNRHASVPVYLSKYINVKKMITKNNMFIRFCMYQLGRKMIEKNILSDMYSKNSGISLFFHTMNGGYIATQLALLFNLNMVFLDHLGPCGSLHRKHFEKSIVDNEKYVIVSDVVCLGGELSRAKTIIEYCGGKVIGEVCIADIKTITTDSEILRTTLYSVSKDNNKLKYLIKTELCENCERREILNG